MHTTLSALLAKMASKPDAALVFDADGYSIRPGYHVSEIKLAHVRSVDCGRGEDDWHETLVQLLDGPLSATPGGDYMSAGKFVNIADAVLDSIGSRTEGELIFEFAPGNSGIRKFSVGSVEYRDDAWIVQLSPVGAACKPALRTLAAIAQSAVGAGGTENRPSKSSCCGAASKSAC